MGAIVGVRLALSRVHTGQLGTRDRISKGRAKGVKMPLLLVYKVLMFGDNKRACLYENDKFVTNNP